MKVNEAYIPFLESDKPICVLMGGSNSGKSYAVAQKIIIRLMENKRCNFLAITKTERNLFATVFSTLGNVIKDNDLENQFTITRVPMLITCKNTGNIVMFKGLDDAAKLKSFSEIHNIWMEEATFFTEEDFREAQRRLRGTTDSYYQIILSFNPISSMHWLKKRFFDFIDERAFVLKTTYKDNVFLRQELIDNIESQKEFSPDEYEVYAKANWGIVSDAIIYNNWEVKPDINLDETWYDEILDGADFGFHYPAAVKLGFDKEGNIYVLDEIKLNKATGTDFQNAIGSQFGKQNLIIADSEDPGAIEDMRRNNFVVKAAYKPKDSVKLGIDYIKRNKVYINPKCEHFINEIQTYSWIKDDKSGYYYDKPIKINDHLLDAMRYAVFEKMSRQNLEVKACMSFYY